jgi:hypothetical protein
MPVRLRSLVVLSLPGLVLLAPLQARAQSATAGVRVEPGNVNESPFTAVPDGAGGVFVSFKTPADFNVCPIHVARLLGDGTPDASWQYTPAVALYAAMGMAPLIGVSGPHSVWVFADHIQTNNEQVYMMRHRVPDGLSAPDATSLPFNTQPMRPDAVVAGPGQSVWLITYRNEALRLDPDGTFTTFETPAGVVFGSLVDPTVARYAQTPDGAGGVYVANTLTNVNLNSTGEDLILYRIGSDGSLPWSPASRILTTAQHDQYDPRLAVSASGVVAVWIDNRSLANGQDVYGSRYLTDGSLAAGWVSGGKPIASLAGSQLDPEVISDGGDGAWVAWVDSRSGENDVYYTHVLGNGALAPGFPVNGKPLTAAAGSQITPRIAPDGVGGFFAAWLDYRGGKPDVYGSQVTAAGVLSSDFAADGNALCTNAADKANLDIVAVAPGKAIVLWQDKRDATTNTYALAFPAGAPLAVPGGAAVRLALAPVANPARGALEVRVSSGDSEPIHVELFDIGGRLVEEHVLSGPVREARVRFAAAHAGLYFVRAGQHDARATARVAVTR